MGMPPSRSPARASWTAMSSMWLKSMKCGASASRSVRLSVSRSAQVRQTARAGFRGSASALTAPLVALVSYRGRGGAPRRPSVGSASVGLRVRRSTVSAIPSAPPTASASGGGASRSADSLIPGGEDRRRWVRARASARCVRPFEVRLARGDLVLVHAYRRAAAGDASPTRRRRAGSASSRRGWGGKPGDAPPRPMCFMRALAPAASPSRG
jgi:hypothetical protein